LLLKKKRIITEENFQFIYIGPNHRHFELIKKRFGLESIIYNLGYVNKQNAMKYIFSSDLLYLKLPPNTIGTKIFDYLASGKPILVNLKNGEALELVTRYGTKKYFVFNNNFREYKENLVIAFRLWQKGGIKYQPNKNFINKFSRKKQTSQFVNILNIL